MDWSKGFSATYYLTRVDPATWRDIERIELTGGSVKRTNKGLMESAALDCVNLPDGIIEQWVRVWLDTRQGGSSDHVALFTGLATSPGTDINGLLREGTMECYSVLKPAQDVVLMRGWYAPAGASGGDVIRQLLDATPAPVVVADNSPRLQQNIIAEQGETNLTMVQRVLQAINWRIRIDGSGQINVGPISAEPVATFDPLEYDVIEPEIGVERDLFACPNVLLAIQDDLTAVARDDDPNSPLSTVSRGREVWVVEDGCDLANNESIAEYAARRLRELQQTATEASYSRRYMPGVIPGDYVRLHYPAQGLDGVYIVQSQSVALSYAARTSEDVATENIS